MSTGEQAVPEEPPLLICEFCGLPIEDEEQQCLARDEGEVCRI